MTDWVRVKHAGTPGLEYTVTRERAAQDPQMTILDRHAVDINGVPLDQMVRVPKANISQQKEAAK